MIKKNILLSTIALTTFATFSYAQDASNLNEGLPLNQVDETSTPDTAITNAISVETEEVNKIIYDVFIAGKLQGNVLVNYTSNWVEVNNVNDILQQMNDINTPTDFEQLLTGKIPARSSRVKTGVGQVYVDTNNFALYIDVDQEQTTLKRLDGVTEIQTDKSSWTGQNAMTLNTAIDSESTGDAVYNLGHSTSISNGPWRLNFDGNTTNENNYNVNSAVIEMDKNAKRYSTGMLETQGTSFVASAPFYGLQIRDNYSQLSNLHDFESAPLELYIPSRSKVTILKDGTQLIYNKILEFGFQQITTSSFPPGSYNLDITIEQQDGTITEETQLFQKGNSLTAYGHPTFNIQFGALRDNFDLKDGYVFQADYAKRLTGSTDARISVYGNESFLTFEPHLKTTFKGMYTVNTALNVTSAGDVGFKGSIYRRKQYSPLTWHASINQVLAGHEDVASSSKDYDDLSRLVAGSDSSLSAGMAYQYKDFTFNLNGRQNTSDSTDTNYAYGPSVLWNVYNNLEHRVTAEARFTYTNLLNSTSLIANYRYVPRTGDIRVSANAGRVGVGGEYNNKTTQTFGYNKLNNYGPGYSVNLANNYITNDKSNSNSTTVNYTLRTSLLGLNAVHEAINSTTNGVDSSRNRTDLTLKSNIIITKNGITAFKDGSSGLEQSPDTTKLLLTSKKTLSSGMVIDLKGNAVGTSINILSNGTIIATAKVGERITIDIPEYKKSVISLSPTEEGGLLAFDSGDVEITLNPNTVFHKEWYIDNVTIALGRLINLNGTPLAWEKIEGIKDYATTDASGYFQVELLGTEMPYLQNLKTSCTFALPHLEVKELFNNLGDIVCG